MTDKTSILLGVNIDHVATLRQARGVTYPEPLAAARIAMHSGADSITVHLREDRRHIQEYDVFAIRALEKTPLNLEMAATPEMTDFAVRVQPHYCCIVPEKREELTTEGGLDVQGSGQYLESVCQRLRDAGIKVSLFIDPREEQVEAACRVGANSIELHTGHYANATSSAEKESELARIRQGVLFGQQSGLQVNAGHGLNYDNVAAVAAMSGISELNIGHAIVARAVMTGMHEAVQSMKTIMLESRS
jgi:pyridoxine 5-phosphate synthase